MKAAHVTRFLDTVLGKAAAQFLRKHWLSTEHVIYGDDRLGRYFLEKGAALYCLDTIRRANKLGITVSGDINSCSNMWKYGKSMQEIIPDLVQNCYVVISSSRVSAKCSSWENRKIVFRI